MDIGRKTFFALHPVTKGAGTSPYVTYMGIASLDPKAPGELKILGPALWMTQFLVVSTVLFAVDPLRIREGEGLDEIWYSGWNPLFTAPGKVVEEIKSWDPMPEEPDLNPWRYVWD